MTLYPCPRCNGNGKVSFAKHYANGVCFACNGAGKLSASAKSLSDAERTGLELAAHTAEVEARAATPAQRKFLFSLANKAGVSESALVCAANGMRAGYHSPEMTKAEVSKALAMFKDMTPNKIEAACYSKAA